MDPADLCKTCGKEVHGGDAYAFVLPSPVSSYHEQHHLECLLRVEREACAKIAESLVIPGHSVQAPSMLNAAQKIRARSA